MSEEEDRRPRRRRSVSSNFNFTHKYDFIKGSFDLSRIPVKYYMYSIPLKYVAEDLKLVSDISKLSNQLWDVSNVFQRNIDEDRVENNIVKAYLNDYEKIKFFNPLTIAFVPIKEDKIVDKYEVLDIPSEIKNAYFSNDEETKIAEFHTPHNLSNVIYYEDDGINNGVIC